MPIPILPLAVAAVAFGGGFALVRYFRSSRVRLVDVDPAARASAIQDLVRPDELEADSARLYSVSDVADWVGRFRYMSDVRFLPDQWQSPSRTVERGGGDCDDLSILAASALLKTGAAFDIEIVISRNHMWVEGYDWCGPFILEATSGQVMRDRAERYCEPVQVVSV